ncbi:MAG: hypothetical protein N2202_05210 [Proteobacteria bacterium]|nr:hypothetical protein [Pseudomonadota bacterium]
MKKTLYLYKTQNYSLKRDGPSLLVSHNRRSPIRIPYELVDFVYINFPFAFVNKDILLDFAIMKKAVVVSMPGMKGTIHIIPYYDGGYFLDLAQRLTLKKEVIKKEFHAFLMTKRKEIQALALKVIDRNLSIAFKQRNCNTVDYEYYIMNFCGKGRKRFFIVKKCFRDLFFGLISSKCIEYELDPNEGIINDKQMMGFVKDLMSALDPITDVLSLKFFSYKQDCLWKGYKTLNERGFKLLTSIFEQRKPVITKVIDRFLRKVLMIIYGKES